MLQHFWICFEFWVVGASYYLIIFISYLFNTRKMQKHTRTGACKPFAFIFAWIAMIFAHFCVQFVFEYPFQLARFNATHVFVPLVADRQTDRQWQHSIHLRCFLCRFSGDNTCEIFFIFCVLVGVFTQTHSNYKSQYSKLFEMYFINKGV